MNSRSLKKDGYYCYFFKTKAKTTKKGNLARFCSSVSAELRLDIALPFQMKSVPKLFTIFVNKT